MSKEDIFAEEVARRRKAIDDLQNGLIDVNAALEQFNDLDESYKVEQKEFKSRLECIYKETRHYNGNWPIVYDFAKTDRYPYFNGDTDDDCNPYYRISEVIAGNDDGIAPQFSEPTRSGGPAVNRFRSYTNENTLRSSALSALQAYPDKSDEVDNGCGECSNPSYTDESTCTINGGTWTTEYCPGDTAVEKLQNALNPWRAELVELKNDICQDEYSTPGVEALIQNIIDEIDTILAELPPIPTYPDNTPDPEYECSNPAYLNQSSCELNGHTWFSPLQDAIDATVNYIQTDMVNDVDSRKTALNERSELLEKKFFAIIGLRLHQINGSFSKVKSLKEQKNTNLGLISDHKKSIADINVLRVKES